MLTYNILGNGASGWTLASPNVQAVGRQLAYLQPDIIGFQEVPEDFRLQMTNFIGSYLPGYFVAIGSGTGGDERSAVASRYPIVRSKSWLVNQNLTVFWLCRRLSRATSSRRKSPCPGLRSPCISSPLT